MQSVIKICFGILLLLYSNSIVFSQSDLVCMNVPEETMSGIVVELKTCRVKVQSLENVNQQLEEYKEVVDLFRQKETLYQEIIELQKKELEAANRAIKEYQEHIVFIQNSYKELLKDVKPNPFMETLKTLLWFGSGTVLGGWIK